MVALAIWLGLLLPGNLARGADATKPAKSPDSPGKHLADDIASTNFFLGPIQRFEVIVGKSEMAKLAGVHGWGGAKVDVPATVKFGTNTYEKVSIHIKGAAGSFRPIFANPALTLNFGKLNDGQKFAGMRKLHLNNSVQDGSRVSEYFCGELYRRAGVPATRATHAYVTLNGRDLGLYVVKEGFDKPFLRRNFGDASGNLYDGGFVQDVDSDLERDNGEGPDTHADLHALTAAAMESNPATRLKKLEKVLDVDRFITVVAMQCLLDDWDGYVRNRNNYRIYHDPVTDKLVFLPHGMDQMVENPTSPIIRPFGGLVARQMWGIPEIRTRINERIAQITNTIFTSAAIDEILDPVQKRLAAAVEGRQGDSQWVVRAGNGFRSRLVQRLNRLTTGVPTPLKFDSTGIVSLSKKPWTENGEGNAAELSRVEKDGKPCLSIRATQTGGVGSFRTSLLLPAGLYRFETRAKADQIEATQSIRGTGAGIRVSGDGRANRLTGTTDWQPLSHDFEIEESPDGQQVQLVIELRANHGEVLFDLSSFVLRRL